jgi:hypothetical protein
VDDGGSATSPTHSAFLYDGARDYAAFLVPFICAALERGEFVAVATASRRIGLLRRALGPDAPRVHFLADTDWYVRPARTIAGWAHLLRTHPGAHLINEIPDPTDAWIRYESALTAALAGQDAGHVLCPHPRDQERTARRTHHIVYDHGWHHSDDFVPPERLLPTLPEPEYPIAGPPVVAVPVNDTVADLRALVRTRATEEGWLAPERVETLVLTLSELATNGPLVGRAGLRRVRPAGRCRAHPCPVRDPALRQAGIVRPDRRAYFLP